MLIDCDTCTARGAGCADCVVTVLLGAPPGWESGPVVVPLSAPRRDTGSRGAPGSGAASGSGVTAPSVVELDDVEQRAVDALAAAGLVPPLRHEPGRPHPPARVADHRRTG